MIRLSWMNLMSRCLMHSNRMILFVNQYSIEPCQSHIHTNNFKFNSSRDKLPDPDELERFFFRRLLFVAIENEIGLRGGGGGGEAY